MKYLSSLLVLMLLSSAAINCMESSTKPNVLFFLDDAPQKTEDELFEEAFKKQSQESELSSNKQEMLHNAEILKRQPKELGATMNKDNAKLTCILGFIPCCTLCCWPAAGYFWYKAHKEPK